jgi:hypothetical protein
MKRIHIRTYRIAETGDIRVTGWRRGDSIDLSAHYEGAAHDRRHTARETTLDVFRHEDDRLGWALSATGHDVDSAQTIRLLLGLFVEDSDRGTSDPRAL